MQGRDDLGNPCHIPSDVRRVVSLVPSLTEAIAHSAPGRLVGATDWCTHPAGLDVTRIGGTKNPDVRAVVDLAPDLVLANEEENREVDIELLRAAGVPVWVTDIRAVPQALDSIGRILELLNAPERQWLDKARTVWADPPQVCATRRVQAVVPIWRRPWMALGRDTYAGDVLARLGVDHVLSGHEQRYPRFDPADLPEVEVVVLPDEPYRFTAQDGPEAFPQTPCALVDGRSLTWYGPATVAAAAELAEAIRAVLDDSPRRAG